MRFDQWAESLDEACVALVNVRKIPAFLRERAHAGLVTHGFSGHDDEFPGHAEALERKIEAWHVGRRMRQHARRKCTEPEPAELLANNIPRGRLDTG